MERKIVFIDVDGTLVDIDEIVLDSAKYACMEARKNGHLLFLCTGRSKAEIYESILSVGFDGIIGAGGGYVELGNELLYHKKVSNDSVRRMVDYFNQHGIDFYLESNGGLYASEQLIPHIERRFHVQGLIKENQTHPFIAALIVDDNLYRTDVNKVCFLEHPTISFQQIKEQFVGEFEVIQCTVPMFGEQSGELMIPGIHKAVAIEAVIRHLGIAKESTMAIGDGLNDIEMLAFCEIGVAMDNAKESLKLIADDCTDTVAEDGLYHCFKKYGLIT